MQSEERTAGGRLVAAAAADASSAPDSPSKCGSHQQQRQSRARTRGLSVIDPKFIAEVGVGTFLL